MESGGGILKHAGADWVESALRKPLSPFGRQVADLLGYLYAGIYHIEHAVQKVDWSNDRYIVLKIGTEASLATWDFNYLTTLVLLCHRMAIRCEVSPCNPQKITLHFHKRQRTGGMAERHPTIEEAIQWFEKHCDVPNG